MDDSRTRLRVTFDEAAQLYDAVRPGYPHAMFDEIATLSGISAGGRVLEVGCGTGQATLPLARRGYRITCVELGVALADVARKKLAAFPETNIVVGAFEDWNVEAGAFDLVTSFTAWHWIDPCIKYVMAAQALRPGGWLALAWNVHVHSDESEGFFDAVQAVYEREAPDLAASFHPFPATVDAREVADEIERSGLFGDLRIRHFRWEEEYSTERYLQLLSTYSDHRTLPADVSRRLLTGIGSLIDDQFGGHVAKGYVTALYLARCR